MFRRLPGTLAGGLRRAPARVAQQARFNSTKPPVVEEPVVRNTGTKRPARWIGTTFAIGTGALLLTYYYDTRSVAHEHLVMPVIRAVADAEDGHKIAIKMLSAPSWARPQDMGTDGPELQAEIFGLPVSNPIGIAAGFDKDAQAIDGLFDLGFGYVEIGSVTPTPQPGNPKPRFFRLEEDDAAINRYGFNSQGHGQALARLRGRVAKFADEHPSLFPNGLGAAALPPAGLPRSLRPGHLLGVNLGKNKTSAADSDDDYIRGVRTLGPYADVLVVNVSSPNTPGLRALQGRETLERLLASVVEERNKIAVDGLPKVAVKVTCDLSEEELADVASAVRSTGVDGVIISNTTVRRDELGLQSAHKNQVGGLSGRPLFPYALHSLRTLRPLLPPSIPIIGAGGVWTGEDALAMARAGASLVQIYTSFGYRGVGAPRLVKDEVSAALPGAATWKSEIGRDYAGANMGWDEKRVAAESAALAAEAQSLGALLADLKEREDAAAMAEQANAAMAEIKAAGEHAKAAAKANAADAATAAQNAATGLIAAVAAVEPAPVAPRSLPPPLPSSHSTSAPHPPPSSRSGSRAHRAATAAWCNAENGANEKKQNSNIHLFNCRQQPTSYA